MSEEQEAPESFGLEDLFQILSIKTRSVVLHGKGGWEPTVLATFEYQDIEFNTHETKFMIPAGEADKIAAIFSEAGSQSIEDFNSQERPECDHEHD